MAQGPRLSMIGQPAIQISKRVDSSGLPLFERFQIGDQVFDLIRVEAKDRHRRVSDQYAFTKGSARSPRYSANAIRETAAPLEVDSRQRVRSHDTLRTIPVPAFVPKSVAAFGVDGL